jgi:hypothetical protein
MNDDGSFSLSLRFDTVAQLFHLETGLPIKTGPYGPWCKVSGPENIELALQWKAKVGKFVFLRDMLELSVALDVNLAEEGVYTKLGQAEHDAKTDRDKLAVEKLETGLLRAIKRLTPLQDVDGVCAVPPSPGKSWDLPTELAKRIAESCGKLDLSGAVSFSRAKQSVKSLALADKWAALEVADLRVTSDVKGNKILLIDDKYQSGTTCQFVASKLYEAGASTVYGLYCVKTWRDTDNT